MSEQHEERLQKALARAGIASRRGSEELIMAGRVKVNGKIVTELGTKIDPARDKVAVDDEPVAVKANAAPQKIYIVLNKPTGYLSTVSDPQGRPTIMDLLERNQTERLFPVGRLDADTEGLLLLTNDGAFANTLSHPRFGVEKEYVALLDGIIAMKDVDQLRRGVTIPVEDLETGERVNHLTKPARVELIRHEGSNSLVRFILKEGKKRQIRLMADAVDHPVIELRRVRLGPLKLGDLGSGKSRNLSKQEIKDLQEASKPNPDQPEVTFTPPPSRGRPPVQSGRGRAPVQSDRVEPFKSPEKPRRFGERSFGEGAPGRGGPRRGPQSGPGRFEREEEHTGRPTPPRRGPAPGRGLDRGLDRFEREDAPAGRPSQPGRGPSRGPQSGPGRFEREETHTGRPTPPRRGPAPDRFEREDAPTGRPTPPRRGPDRFEREDAPTQPRRNRPEPSNAPDFERGRGRPGPDSGRPAPAPRRGPARDSDSPAPVRPFRAPGGGGAPGSRRNFSRPNPNGFVPAAERSAPSPGRGRPPARKSPNAPESPARNRPGGPGPNRPGPRRSS